MGRRLGVTAATFLALVLLSTNSVWAFRCFDRVINRCGARRACIFVRVRPVWCRPTCCVPTCCASAACCCQLPAVSSEGTVIGGPTLAPAVDSKMILDVAPNPPAETPKTVIKGPESPKPVLPPLPPPEAEKPAEAKAPVKPEAPKPEPPKPVAPIAPPVPEMPKPAPAPAPAPANNLVPEMPKPAAPEAPKPEAPKAPEPAVPETPKAPEMPKPEAPKAPEAPKPEAPKVPEPAAPEAPKPPAAPKKPADDNPFGQNDTNTLRKWVDASGNHAIEARLVSFQDGTVRLQKDNGRYVRIAYDLLSRADQQFVLMQDMSLIAAE